MSELQCALCGGKFKRNILLEVIHSFARIVDPFDSYGGLASLIVIPYIIGLIIGNFNIILFGLPFFPYFYGLAYIEDATDGMALYGNQKDWWFGGLCDHPYSKDGIRIEVSPDEFCIGRESKQSDIGGD